MHLHTAAVTQLCTHQHCVDPTRASVPGVTVVATTGTYEVYGRTAAALREQLDAKGPGAYDAKTRWDIAWSFDDCDSPSWQVKLTVHLTLPKWVPPADVSAGLVRKWTRYLAALRCHELGHAGFGLTAASQTHKALSAIVMGRCCQSIALEGRAVFEPILAAARAAEVRFDAQTDHGQRAGATFP